MSVYFEFDDVDAFTVGAVGRPGQRVFLIQVRHGRQRVTVKCEKQQVAAIAEYLRTVLNDLPPADERPMPAALELVEPLEVAFVLGPIGLGYERINDRLLIQLDEFTPAEPDDDDDDEDDDDDLDLDLDLDDEDLGRVRAHLTRGQVLAFCTQADAVVAAGRPPCIWCDRPLDPDGHICPRMN